VRGQTAKDLAAATRAEFKRRHDRLLEYIRHLDALIVGPADMVRLDAAVLRQQRDELRGQADQITVQQRVAPEELVAVTRAEFKRHRDRLLGRVRHLDALIEGAADMPRLNTDVLRGQRDDLQELADRITAQLHTHNWIYFGILQTAERAGTVLKYTSPSKGKKKPHGPGIDYLIAAAAAQGYEIGPDRARDLLAAFNKMLPLVGAEFGGAGALQVSARVFDASGNEVLDDANRPKPKGQPGDE
jgi:hypothetical protein